MIHTKGRFLCTGNSARSQMAEGWLRQLADEHVAPLTAGLNPRGLNPLAIEVMREVGVDISQQVSKNVTEFLGQPIQHVITVCDNAHERCPIFPFAYQYLHWSVSELAASADGPAQMTAFRDARDLLKKRITEELLPLLVRRGSFTRD